MKTAKKTANRKTIPRSFVLVGVGVVVCCLSFVAGRQTNKNGSLAVNGGRANGQISLVKSVADWKPEDVGVFDLWTLTNKARQDNGLDPLSLSPALDNSAAAKCADMVAKNYWAHNDPSGQEPWHFIKESGVNYEYAAENLAEGYDTAAGVLTGWMNSEGHKANILNGNFNQVGFAACKATATYSSAPDTLIVVQHFTN